MGEEGCVRWLTVLDQVTPCMYCIVQTAYNSMSERKGQYCSKLVICPLLSPKYAYQFLVMCAKERKGVCVFWGLNLGSHVCVMNT